MVILDIGDYNKEMERLLSDTNTYLRLKNDPTPRYKKELTLILSNAKQKQILSNKEFNYLNIRIPRIPVMYYLPKVHKDKNNPPGRPIVSGISSLTSRLSEYIDIFLQGYVSKMNSYLKDSKSVIDVLKDIEIEDGPFLFCSCDVSSLYTSIPQFEGVLAVKECMEKYNDLTLEHREFLLESIKFCLQKNYFWYANQFYNQITERNPRGVGFLA